jgi:hypothetical protein
MALMQDYTVDCIEIDPFYHYILDLNRERFAKAHTLKSGKSWCGDLFEVFSTLDE